MPDPRTRIGKLYKNTIFGHVFLVLKAESCKWAGKNCITEYHCDRVSGLGLVVVPPRELQSILIPFTTTIFCLGNPYLYEEWRDENDGELPKV